MTTTTTSNNNNKLKDLFRTEAASVLCHRIICPESIEELQHALQKKDDNDGDDYHHRPPRVAVVGGGHSTLCTRPNALIIDLRHSSTFSQAQRIKRSISSSRDPTTTATATAAAAAEGDVIVEMGGGASIQAVCEALRGSGWSVPLGTFSSVGAGLALQGGIGFLTRSYGLTIDAIVGAQVVDMTGKVWDISHDNKDDNDEDDDDDLEKQNLLWSLKGGGNQIGGIVTKLFLRAVPVEDIWMERLLIRIENAVNLAKCLSRLWNLALGLKSRTETLSFIVSNTQTHGFFHLYMVYSNIFESTFSSLSTTTSSSSSSSSSSTTEAFSKSQSFLSQNFESNERQTILFSECQMRKYSDTMGFFEIPSEFMDNVPIPFEKGENNNIHVVTAAAIHTAFLGGKDFFLNSRQIDDLAISISNQMMNQVVISTNGSSCYTLPTQIYFQQLGGAVRDIEPTETAFWNRKDTLYSAVITVLYPMRNDDDNNDVERKAYAWVDDVEQLFVLNNVKVGTYSVDIMREEEDDEKKRSKLSTKMLLNQAYGANWDKIQSIRSILDPHGRLQPNDV